MKNTCTFPNSSNSTQRRHDLVLRCRPFARPLTARQRTRPWATLTILLFAFLAPIVSAQVTIRGTVTDAKSGETLPSSSLHIDGTLIGTITNSEGRFEFELPSVPATVIVRFIGYETQRINVTGDTGRPLNIRLVPSAFQMDELVVTAENQAVRIMRRVIEEKQKWQANLETWQAEVYNRFTISNDTGIVSIIERLNAAYWHRSDGLREVVKAKRETENIDLPIALPAADQVLNFYSDNIEVFGFDAVGPTHPRALSYYHFELTGRRVIDQNVIYDIRCWPKNKLQPAFVGNIAVLDGVFGILEVDLKPSAAIYLPPPVGIEVSYRQQFNNFGQQFWLPVDYHSAGAFKFSITGFTLPPIGFDQVARFTTYQTNVVLPDSLFETKRGRSTTTVDSVSVATIQLAQVPGATVPLSAREEIAYIEIDSTDTFEKAFQPRGFLARLFLRFQSREQDRESSTDVSSDGETTTVSIGGGGSDRNRRFFSFSPRLGVNRVEGIHAGVGMALNNPKTIRPVVFGAYQTALKDWSFGAGLSVAFGKNRRNAVSVNATRLVSPVGESIYPSLLTSMVYVAGGGDYLDYYRNDRVSLSGLFRPFKSRSTALRVGVQAEKHSSLASRGTFSRILASDRTSLTANPYINDGTVNSIIVGLESGNASPTPFIQDLSISRGASIQAEWSTTAMGSEYSFLSIVGEGRVRIPTLYKRRLFPPSLDVMMKVATFTGEPPVQRASVLDGTLFRLQTFGTFKTVSNAPVLSQRFAAVFWEHNFRGILMERLGLAGLARKGMYLGIHGAHGLIGNRYTRPEIKICDEPSVCVPVSTYSVFTNQSEIHELGIAIHRPFGWSLRVDVTRRMEKDGMVFISFGLPKIF